MPDPLDIEWCVAACVDAIMEGLTLQALQSASDVAATPEEFFWAIQASIRLKEIVNARPA